MERGLRGIVLSPPWLVELLEAVRAVGPPGAYVAAGAVRDTVWDRLTGRTGSGPRADVDVVHFDADGDDAGDRAYERALRARVAVDWEVTNQATVHLWHASRGVVVPAHRSVDEGLRSWPETATAVGARLDGRGGLEVLAPFGLEDLMSLQLRHNEAGADREVFWKRVRDKRWLERWPELKVVGSEGERNRPR